jgi:ParB family transcriptional regulator, chromosome partitioning protein
MAKSNQMTALDEEFKVGRLESKIKDYEIDIAELQQEVDRLRLEGTASNFDGTIDPNILVPSRWQPRTTFDPIEMQEIEDSILAAGEVITPVLLLRDTNELIAGEQRTRLAAKLGMNVKFRRLYITDEVAADYAALENIKRSGLNPIDETNAVLDAIVRKLNLDTRDAAATLIRQIKNEIGGQVYKNNVILKETAQQIETIIKQFTKGSLSLPSFASNRLKLLNIPEEIKQAISNGEIDYTKGTEIAKVKDDEARNELLQRTIKDDLSIREVKKAANLVKPPKTNQKKISSDKIESSTDLTSDRELFNAEPVSVPASEPSEAELDVKLEEKSEAILHAIRNKSLSLSTKQESICLLDRLIALLN